MVSTTPVYGLPYPDNTDALKDAVKSIPASLASQIESTLQGFGGIAAPGSWNAVSFGTNVINFGAPHQVCQYRKIGNFVYVRGFAVASGGTVAADATLITLPAGFRPPAELIFTTFSAPGIARLEVYTTGKVSLPGNALTAGQYVSLTLPPFAID